ncbi:VRR-NUC domain-containing protein [Mesorhizobium sp.]|uniref:VRR-NUC domain-containing protein n=1 Tax=Mesorhizobium sp. TaxID=1871066 RepID=UPI00122130F6|nr:VRR-NUC domain-containing protein [Mesorhizobium sp.]TIL38542.1 MAG: VRR-NUC domain-containing protein [Mesorhizobium sp.]
MPSTRKQTTTRINGKRVRIVTQNGKTVVTDAPIEEWKLQAAGVRAQRGMPEYVDDPKDVKPSTFTIAGDFNAARRSMREQVKAKATGLTPGEHDERIYMFGGVMGLIEFKGAETPVSRDQKKRHALLAALGFTRQAIVKAATEEDAADQAVSVVRGWLAANDNQHAVAEKIAADVRKNAA